MRILKIGGIQLRLNYWCIVLFILFSLAGMYGKVALVFSAVLWHELAHAKVAIFLDYKTKEIELLPFGGVARIEGFAIVDSRSEIMIAAAGPAASLVLAALAYMGMLCGGLWKDVWEFYVKINVMLAVFNLLPGLPLDGGRIFRAWLALYMDYGKATSIAAGISKGLSVSLIILGIYEYLCSQTINVTFLMAAIFLYTTARGEIKVVGFRMMRILGQKKAKLISEGIMPTAYLTVVQDVLLKDIIRSFRPEQYYVLCIVDQNCKLCGTVTEIEIWEELPRKGIYTKVGEFIS